jgi:fructose/tagatose bisphosphate aldolase
MNKLNINAETKKIVTDKIEEMYKEVDYKIADRQKKLDDKFKEMEDQVKGKKK